MTEPLKADGAAVPMAADVGVSPGQRIRAAREARGQTLLHLSILLKISERRLQAFEDGRWDEVGDITFVRALAQSLCRHLDVEPAPVLQALPAVKPQTRPAADQGRLPEPGLPSLKALRTSLPIGSTVGGKPWFTPLRGAVALILAAALGVALMPPVEWFSRPPAEQPSPGLVVSAPVAGASEPATASATGAVPVASAPAALPTTSATTVPTAPASTPAGIPRPAQAPASANEPSATAPLQLKATKDTWVQVTDARGQVLLSRLLISGERVGVEGSRPFRLRVGNVSGTEAVWLGRRVALEEQQRNNVADVELP